MSEQFINGIALGCGFAVGSALWRVAADALQHTRDWFAGKAEK